MHLRWKSPGWPLAFYSPLWAAAGIYIGVRALASGSQVLGTIWLLMGLTSVLIWFDWKWVAWPLLAYFGVALVGAATIAIGQGPTLMLLLRVLIICFFIHALLDWAWWRSPPPQSGRVE